ncbi:MAG: uracil phosphoribosyltransferase [Cyclobacteriaceae bacterium]|nr:uracil phosphoribosyltransferase [Cyclobacteriaceae bacterium]MCH8517564.1 uracil phosphoribosyltransferase [Cyclobacteriaceae bacterium]
MKVFELNKHNKLANHYLAALRDVSVQHDRLHFRRNLERLGEMIAYELAKDLEYQQKEITTPLAVTEVDVLKHQPVIITILRAGVPFYQGFMNVFEDADSGFFGAYRLPQTKDNQKVEIEMGYEAVPRLDDREIVICDPMLASGKSLVKAIDQLLAKHKPRKLHVASVIAAAPGVEFLKKSVNFPISFWTAAIDNKLDDRSYIVPGLGDAGDLCFGPKE